MDISELKKALRSKLAEDGDYKSLAKSIREEESDSRSEKMIELMTPISAFADMLTENSKGAFMEDLTERVDEETEKSYKKLKEEFKTKTGTSAPTITPKRLGEIFIDKTAGNIYMAKGTDSSADWVRLNI